MSGQSFGSAGGMIDAYLMRFGERAGASLMPLDSTGYTSVQRGAASVGISVLEDHGVLLFVAAIMPLPVAAEERFYLRLLELSFLSTADAAFAVDAERQEIVVRALRRLSGLDYEEFEDLLQTVGRIASQWHEAI